MGGISKFVYIVGGQLFFIRLHLLFVCPCVFIPCTCTIALPPHFRFVLSALCRFLAVAQLDRGQVAVNDLAMVMRDNTPRKSHRSATSSSSSTTALSAVASALTNNTPLPTPPLTAELDAVVDPSTPSVVTSPICSPAVKGTDTPPPPSKPTTAAAITAPLLARKPNSFEATPIGNLLGTGLGYGLSLGAGESAKADGVAVYLKRGATLILSHVLGPKVFGEKALTWEDHVAINLKKSAMITLELQHQEKLLRKDQQQEEASSDIALKNYASPKKMNRNKMMFDPSSPSNASTGRLPSHFCSVLISPNYISVLPSNLVSYRMYLLYLCQFHSI